MRRIQLTEKFIREKVMDHFKDADVYRVRKGIVHEEDLLLISFIQNHASYKDKILEVGGGSGAFLDLVLENTSIKEAYNVELVFEAYRNQANEKIYLIGGDTLNLPFKDYAFEWVVAKNLLHHLVGKTRRQSKENAYRAVDELIRVTKRGGYVIILELYNQHRFFFSIIFYLTLFFSVFGFSLKLFGLGKNVIVSFFTPYEIKNMVTKNWKIKIVKKMENKLDIPWMQKCTLLMSNIGRLTIIGQKGKFEPQTGRTTA